MMCYANQSMWHGLMSSIRIFRTEIQYFEFVLKRIQHTASPSMLQHMLGSHQFGNICKIRNIHVVYSTMTVPFILYIEYSVFVVKQEFRQKVKACVKYNFNCVDKCNLAPKYEFMHFISFAISQFSCGTKVYMCFS